MKRICKLSPVLMLVVFLLCTGVRCAPADCFATEPLSQAPDFLCPQSGSPLLTVYDKEPLGAFICFAVRHDGMLALGFRGGDGTCVVSVYDEAAWFVGACGFSCPEPIGLLWEGDTLKVAFQESGVLATLTEDGFGDMVKIQNTGENKAFWKNSVYAKEKRVGDAVYRAKDPVLSSLLARTAYSTLLRIPDGGSQRIIYHAASDEGMRIAGTVIWLVLIGGSVFFFLRKLRVKKR